MDNNLANYCNHLLNSTVPINLRSNDILPVSVEPNLNSDDIWLYKIYLLWVSGGNKRAGCKEVHCICKREMHSYFSSCKTVFMNTHSTLMALIILIENLVNAMDNGKCAVGIFLDFQKAFDTVDHCILLDKLYFYGIRGMALDWFSSYLHDRKQLVNYCGCESDLKKIKCGVPQGSILGPLLFLLYMNDLPQASEYFMPILFADDTNLFATGYNLNDIISQINKEIDNVYAWVKANNQFYAFHAEMCTSDHKRCFYCWEQNYGSDWNKISRGHHWL